MKDVQFEQTRRALQSKQRDLKRKGMGNKPNASAALSEEDIQVLFEKDLLGSSTAEVLLNTVWFNNIIHFGLLQGAQRNVFKGRRKTLSKLPQGRSTSNSMKEKPKLVQETIHGM